MPTDSRSLTLRSMRLTIAVSSIACLLLAGSAVAASPAKGKWRWITAQTNYFSAAKGPIRATVSTGLVLEWPVEQKNFVFPAGTTDNEARVRVTLSGVTRGEIVNVAATRTCTNAADLDATSTSTITRPYALAIKGGVPTLLPAAVQPLHDGVSCSWSLVMRPPGTKISVAFEVFSPLNFILSDPAGGTYARQACASTLSAVAQSHSCKPIP